MPLQGSIIDYTGGAGDRNFTVFILLAFTGSYVPGGDTLNLTGSGTLPLLNPNGLEVEGFFEEPLTLGPAVYIESLGGYYIQPKPGANLAAQLVQLYIPGGTEETAIAYPGAVTGGTAVLTIQRRRV